MKKIKIPFNLADGVAIFLLLFAWFLYTLSSVWELFYPVVPQSLNIAEKIIFAFLSFAETGRALFDDAFMFVRYADNFLAGYGYSWNREEGWLYGCTSIVYLLLVTAVRALFSGVAIESVLHLSAYFCGLLAILVWFFIFKTAQSQSTLRQRLYGVMLLFFYFIYAADGIYFTRIGMDTNAALLMNTLMVWVVICYWRSAVFIKVNSENTAVVWPCTLIVAALLTYIAYLTRPDSLLLSGGAMGLAMLLKPANWHKGRVLVVQDMLVYVGLVAALLICDALLKNQLFGDFLPLSHYVKTQNFYQGYIGYYKWNTWQYLADVFRWLLIILPLWVLFFHRNNWRLLVVLMAPVLVLFVYYQQVTQIMGFNGRYYFPALPYFIALVLSTSEFSKAVNKQRMMYAVMILITVYALIQGLEYKAAGIDTEGRQARVEAYEPKRDIKFRYVDRIKLPHRNAFKQVTELLGDMPAGTRIAASEVGRIAAFNPQVSVIDVVGLQSRDFAKQLFTAERLIDKQLDIIWMPHFDYSKMRADIYDHPRLWSEYEVYPELYRYGVAIRKASPNFEKIKQALQYWTYRHYEFQRIEDLKFYLAY